MFSMVCRIRRHVCVALGLGVLVRALKYVCYLSPGGLRTLFCPVARGVVSRSMFTCVAHIIDSSDYR
jgi:hypothetical protein